MIFVDENRGIPKQKLLSASDAATVLKLTPQRVRQLIAKGIIQAQKVGRNWAISESEVLRVNQIVATSPIRPTMPHEGKGKLTALSFFSGAMGLDLGLEAAGIDTVLTCESDKWARQTISFNRPDLPVLGDIWRYCANEIREHAGLGMQDEIGVMAGGPPCQAFSTAGARRGFDDLRGNVFLRYIDLVKELNPRYAVIENVRGLLSMPVSETQAAALRESTGKDFSHKHGAIQLVAHLLREAGYAVSFNLYNAANFGTPQVRERVVLIAARLGGPVPHLVPTHSDDEGTGLLPWRTVRETFKCISTGERNYLPFPEKRLKYYRMLGPGQNWKDLPKEIQPEAMGKSYLLGGGKTGFYRRIAWDKPAPTLVTHPAMPATDLGHPTEDRPLSVEEYKAIQQFPDDWAIMGNLQQQYKQIGNAVPLGLGEAIGAAILRHYNGEILESPKGFKYSRYRNTSEAEISPDLDSAQVDTLF